MECMQDTESAIVAFARRVDATAIAADARSGGLDQRALCTRLRAHVWEMLRALARSESECAARVHAVHIARELIASTLAARTHHDPARARFIAWSSTQRTKFFMSTKVDALISLRATGDVAGAAAGLAHGLLAHLASRVSLEARRQVAISTRSLVAELATSLVELGEDVSLEHVAGADALPGWAPDDLELGDTSGDLLAALDTGARRVLVHALEQFDRLQLAAERRFRLLLDSMVESVRHAAMFSTRSRAAGPEAVARDRLRLAESLVSLSQMTQQLAM
jgi:hypothetical protein